MARLLFVGLWNFCDDGGNHPASAKTLKAEVFPSDDITSADVQRLIDELSSNSLIVLYTASNKDYWHVTGWHKHQRIEKPTYRHPEYSPELETHRRGLDDSSTPEGKGEEGKGVESNGKEGNGKETAARNSTVVGATGIPKFDIPPVENPPERHVQISVLLRAASIRPMTAMHPLAIEWAANPKITDELLQTALQTMRDRKPQGEVSPNYLKPIVDELLNPPPPREDNSWRRTDAGIDVKGRELGMMPKPREGYPEFADRISIEIQKRKREGSAAA